VQDGNNDNLQPAPITHLSMWLTTQPPMTSVWVE